jgi:predicted transport protein
MPQGENIPNHWKEMIGDNWKDIFDKYVHTIGNITLTLYNSELSNKSFEKKKDMPGGFRESGLKLNKFVVNSDTWGEKEIKERADQLYKECLKIFPYPDVEKDILDKYKDKKITQEYTLEKHSNYNNIEVKNIFDKLLKFSKNINPNLELNIKKIYINIIENEDIIACLILNKNYISFNFYNWEEIIDENQLISDLTNKNHWGVGDARIFINEETFIKSKSIIEQVIEKYSD